MTAEQGDRDFIRANNKVPSSLTQARLQIKYELLNYLRSRRFYILLAIVAIIGLLIMAVIDYYRPSAYLTSNLAFYSTWWGGVVTLIVVLGGIFFGGDAISGEFQNKTGYYLIPNPIRRSSVYIGKWVAAFIASTIMVCVFAVITMMDGALYFGASIPYQFVESFLLTLVYILPILGITFFFSSLFKNNSYSILVSAILLLFGFSVILELVTFIAKVEPWFILTYGEGIIGNVLSPTGYPTHHVVTIAGTMYSATIPEGLAIMLIYFAVTTLLGLVLFEREEFN
jgi:ABC-2 type transport system permease protein